MNLIRSFLRSSPQPLLSFASAWQLVAIGACALPLLGADTTSPEQKLTTVPVPAAPSATPNRVIADLKLELIWVPPGTFKMGSEPEEPQRDQAEGPRMTVTLSKGFWLTKIELS